MNNEMASDVTEAEENNAFGFSDIFNLEEIQELQDLFSDASGVASVITHPDGTRITRPSNFSRFCLSQVCKTEHENADCFFSNTHHGNCNSETPVKRRCASCGLLDAKACISVGGKHIANWIIGQVRSKEPIDQDHFQAPQQHGICHEEYLSALKEVPVMSDEQFSKVTRMLQAFSRELSEKAYNNLLLKSQIAEQNKVSAALRESEVLNRRIVETANEGIWAMDSNYHTTYVNRKMADMLGYTIDEVMTMNVNDFMFSEDSEEHRLRRLDRMAGKSDFYERRFKRKDGSEIWAIVSSTAILDTEGKFIGSFGMILDITEHKIAELSLAHSEEQFRLIAENTSDAITMLDMNLNFTYFSPSVEKILGLTPDEAIKMKMEQILTPESVEKVRTLYQSFFPNGPMETPVTGDFPTIELEEYHKNGSRIWVELSFSVLIGQNNKPTGIITVTRDVTARKMAENAIKTSEEHLRQTQRVAQIADWEYNIATGKIWGSDEAFRFYGLPVNENHEIEMSGVQPFIQEYEQAKKALFDLIEKDIPYNIESRIIPANGDPPRILHSLGTLVKDDRGNPVKVVGMFQDITKRKQAEETIFMLAHAVRSISECVSITDMNDKIVFVNTAFLKTYLFEEHELLGKSISMVRSQNNPDSKVAQILPATLHGGWQGELFNKRKDGSEFPVFVSTSVIKDDHGEPLALIGVTNDITDRKKAEKELLKLNEELDHRVKTRTAELEAANKELESFSYSVSHDLKAPLRHINGFINLLLDNASTSISEDGLGYLRKIEHSALEMEQLINAILSFSRLNMAELRKTPICSHAMVNEVIRFFEPDTQHRTITFNLEPLHDTTGDHELIRQVWTNLISNAIKYTGKATEAIIDIGSEYSDEKTTFFIRDNGVGFKMQYADKLFGVFQRLHKSRDFEGIGIGLANVNRIIKRHGGECHAEGEPNNGATFSFSLPNK
ncbi:MAG: PAS domain S-box protein [Bacteroidales bacterium]